MFVVSTVKGINLVFNDLLDLDTHIRNLQNYYRECQKAKDDKPPVYGLYPSEANMQECANITQSLQMIFSPEPEVPPPFNKSGEYVQ